MSLSIIQPWRQGKISRDKQAILGSLIRIYEHKTLDHKDQMAYSKLVIWLLIEEGNSLRGMLKRHVVVWLCSRNEGCLNQGRDRTRMLQLTLFPLEMPWESLAVWTRETRMAKCSKGQLKMRGILKISLAMFQDHPGITELLNRRLRWGTVRVGHRQELQTKTTERYSSLLYSQVQLLLIVKEVSILTIVLSMQMLWLLEVLANRCGKLVGQHRQTATSLRGQTDHQGVTTLKRTAITLQHPLSNHKIIL